MQTYHAINNVQGYLRSKLLDNSAWLRVLPRGMIPGDMDFVIDNDGNLLFAEIKEGNEWEVANWDHVGYGQRRVYESIVRAGRGRQTAVLCLVERPPQGTMIDTLKDVFSFQVMTYQDGEPVVQPARPGPEWLAFVQGWMVETTTTTLS